MFVTNTNKQTIVCMKKKQKTKKRTNIMSYLCRNRTSVLSSNDRFKQKPITLTCRTEAGFSKYTNFCNSHMQTLQVTYEGADPGGRTGKNKIFWRKIVIFHTKYPKHFRNYFKCTPPPNLKSWIRPWYEPINLILLNCLYQC